MAAISAEEVVEDWAAVAVAKEEGKVVVETAGSAVVVASTAPPVPRFCIRTAGTAAAGSAVEAEVASTSQPPADRRRAERLAAAALGVEAAGVVAAVAGCSLRFH